ncbi:hypothetical protein HEP87_08760 [Streptomyces sp. S1D4-11]
MVLDGTWSYSSGSPYSTHYVGQTLRAPDKPEDPPGPLVLFVAPRSAWTLLDDWQGVLGLRGSGSHSIRFDEARIPARFTREASLLDLPVEGGSLGSKLHGHPMYAGRAASFFHGELAALMIGTAYAAADEYARIIAERPLVLDPGRTRADLHDYQRHLGEALAAIRTADAALRATADDWMEACCDNVSGRAPSPPPSTTGSRSSSSPPGAWPGTRSRASSSARRAPGTPATARGCSATSGTPPRSGRTSAPRWPNRSPAASAATASACRRTTSR